MTLHTLLGVIGYGIVALFVHGLIGIAVHLAGYKARKHRFQEAERRFEDYRQRVDRFIQGGKKIL